MSVPKFRQARLRVPEKRRRQVFTQFGALCWREKKGGIQVLLVTTRRKGRWIIPKGWPMNGQTPTAAAATEAWEEAGALGEAGDDCLGIYGILKVAGPKRQRLPCMVAVFPFRVDCLRDDFPERGQRRRKWVSPAKAAKLVAEKDLAKIILHFAPPAATAAERRIATG